jgi:hypothetical protein
VDTAALVQERRWRLVYCHLVAAALDRISHQRGLTMVHALWSLYVPSQSVGTSLVFFDLYNGSDRNLFVSSVTAIRDATNEVTGLVAVQLFLTRTASPGSGGTAATSNNTALLSAPSITDVQQSALPNGVTARITPTSGATAGAVIGERQIVPEETLVQVPAEFLETILTVPEGTGIRVVQGATASVGRVGFQVLFY